MSCKKPLKGYRSYPNSKGKRPIVFKIKHADFSLPMKERELDIPCGQCWGCRLDYSRTWAVRCLHESQLHDQNSFITLTYNTENLPDDYSVHKKELQDFFKRLRDYASRDIQSFTKDQTQSARFKYFACGEYGDKNQRPHYHAILFGYNFPDLQYHTTSNSGHPIYRSELLEKAWTKGYSYIGNVTFESCAYVARYVMKKRKGPDEYIDPKTGKTNKEHYMSVNPDTGEIFYLQPEFCLMSRGSGKQTDPDIWRYGIGREWYNKYKSDLEKDYVHINGAKVKVPRYYDSILEQEDAIELDIRKRKRAQKALENASDNTPQRLQAKAAVEMVKLKKLVRPLEENIL